MVTNLLIPKIFAEPVKMLALIKIVEQRAIAQNVLGAAAVAIVKTSVLAV